MTKRCFLAICAMAATACAETGTPPDWSGYYMLARGRDLTGLNVCQP